VTWLVPDRAIK